jgi:AcrR family transcriptional regulator
MTRTRMDRRAERTRRALKSAFLELVLARGYAAVTVGDIIDQANVGRSTFYLHYSGKEALLQESLQGPCSGLAASVGGEVTSEMLTPLLVHFRDQWSINRVFFEHPLRALCVERLAALIERNLVRLRDTNRTAHTKALIPRPLMALLLAEMQIALITHWLAGAAPLEPHNLAQALLTSTHAVLASGAFDRAARVERATA